MNKLFTNSSVISLKSALTFGVNTISRNYAFKSDLKIKWIRPERILCIDPRKTGDQSKFPELDKTKYCLEFQNSKELETADENVQRMFQFGYNRREKMVRQYRSDMIDTVKRHDLDYGSMESKLAWLTATIHSQQELMQKYPRNKRLQVSCKLLIDRRKKFLTYLRRWDYKRYEWILEKLNLVYKSYPSYYHWITRRESLTKLTNIHCDKIRDERLAEYRKELESQQLEFLAKKLKNLEFIRNEQIECEIPVTVSTELIKECRQKYEQVKEKHDREIEAAAKAAADKTHLYNV